jgi:hypothetical protein
MDGGNADGASPRDLQCEEGYIAQKGYADQFGPASSRASRIRGLHRVLLVPRSFILAAFGSPAAGPSSSKRLLLETNPFSSTSSGRSENCVGVTSAIPSHKQEGGLVEISAFVRRSTQLKETPMTIDNSRRTALVGFGALAVGATALATGPSRAAETERIIPPGAQELTELMDRLRRAPRRRDFKTVPMILQHPDFWDDQALNEIIAYRGARKQVWDNTNLAGPWLNLMRNSINAQVFSFGHKDFVAVSATHGTAHLALFDQAMWDKYQLAELAGPKFKTNALVVPKSAPASFAENEDPNSVFGSIGDTIPALQERGAVFLACHNAIWEITAKLIASGKSPDHASHEAVAAELTNHLIDGVVLTPGIVATIPELQQVGFHYAT